MASPPSSTVERGARRSFFRNRRGEEASQPPKPIQVMEEVYKYFRRDIPTLRNVNLTVERGEFVFVTGPSGSGKSTLLQLIYRQHTVDSGRILFSGRDISRLTEKSIPFLRRNLGVVFQDFKVVPHWTASENVAVALEIEHLGVRGCGRGTLVLDAVRRAVADGAEVAGVAVPPAGVVGAGPCGVAPAVTPCAFGER